MNDSLVSRVTGAAAIGAGLALGTAAYLQSLQPRGCVGDECDVRPMRDTPQSAEILLTIGGVLLVTSALGLTLLLWRRRRLGRAGAAGAVLLVGGAGLAALGGFIQAVLADGDLSSMPAFVIPGVGGVLLGVALLAWCVFRARILPPWSAVLIGLGVVLLAFANEQTDTVLLMIPFGLAWTLAGVILIRGAGTATPVGNADDRVSVQGA